LLKREQMAGLLLVGVESDSPAGRSGLIVGDILVAIDAKLVNDPDDLLAVLVSDLAGKVVTVEVLRGGQPHTLQVTVGEQ